MTPCSRGPPATPCDSRWPTLGRHGPQRGPVTPPTAPGRRTPRAWPSGATGEASRPRTGGRGHRLIPGGRDWLVVPRRGDGPGETLPCGAGAPGAHPARTHATALGLSRPTHLCCAASRFQRIRGHPNAQLEGYSRLRRLRVRQMRGGGTGSAREAPTAQRARLRPDGPLSSHFMRLTQGADLWQKRKRRPAVPEATSCPPENVFSLHLRATWQ